ncbi:hypothetical protein ACFYZ4_15035 [Streptomyces sp. NPDC001513]|uniref:hypothetical protein n=1 Tax=Streptomyces sp. NPDC001513 TaxID=3364580 RepID=UPI0036898982
MSETGELRQTEAGWTVWAEGTEFSSPLPLTVAADLLRRVRNGAGHADVEYVMVSAEANESIAAEFATTEEVANAFHRVVSGEALHTVAMPGGFADFFAGTNIAAGGDDSDEECKAARLAFEGGKRRRHGKRGYSVAVTASRRILAIFTEYAETVLQFDAEESSKAERDGALKWMERVSAI